MVVVMMMMMAVVMVPVRSGRGFVTLPPNSRVAAKTASAVRDGVTFPAPDF